jgi:hypothetical protein
MEDHQDHITDELLNNIKRRKDLLPWWIKIFIWIFIVFGCIVPIALVFGIMGYNFQAALYGLESNDPLSDVGLITVFLFLFKGFAAYALWTEKPWGVDIAIADAVLGVLVCCFVMFIEPFIFPHQRLTINIRLELLLLIPYLIKLIKINKEWKASAHLASGQ